MGRTISSLENLERANKHSAPLAEALSIAVRIEPQLLRKMRLALFPAADASAEADLWFSGVVETRSVSGIVFGLEWAEKLRGRLKQKPELLEQAWGIIESVHRDISPLVLAEERLTYLALAGKDDELRALLQRAVASLLAPDRVGAANWASRAIWRLPERVKSLEESQMLAVGAHLRLGDLSPSLAWFGSGAMPEWVAWLSPGNLGTVPLDVALLEDGVVFGPPSGRFSHGIALPKTEPVVVEVSWETGGQSQRHTQSAPISTQQRTLVSTGPVSEVQIRTILNDVYTLRRREVVREAKRLHLGSLGGSSKVSNPGAIVFIHGMSGDWQKAWGRIPEMLQFSVTGWDLYGFGYASQRRFDLLNLWSAEGDIPAIADMLYSKTVNELKGYRALAFVAHSMGGLIAQHLLLNHEDLRQRSSHVFLLGTPSVGLNKANKLARSESATNNLDPHSPFISELGKRWNALNLSQANFQFLTVAAEMEQFVQPGSSLLAFPEHVRRVVPGNHFTMLDCQSESDPIVSLLREGFTPGMTNAEAPPSLYESDVRVAVATGEFESAVQQFWPSGSPAPQYLDEDNAVQLAVALCEVGRREDAIELLRSRTPTGTAALGTLAERLKQRWILTPNWDDYQRALDMYQVAYEQASNAVPPDHEQAYNHGINLAFLALAQQGDFAAALEHARELAKAVIEHCSQSKDPRSVHWRLATEGDALNILGEWEQGLAKHRDAAALPLKPEEAAAMEEQAIRIAHLLGSDEHDYELATIYEGPDSSPLF